MNRISRVLNGMLVLILLLLLGWGGLSWLQPKFPATVNGDDIVPAPRELELPALSRKV
jgi:TRAP-type C4-dicarboxylate transport system permease small subunit